MVIEEENEGQVCSSVSLDVTAFCVMQCLQGNNKASNPGSWLSLIFDMFTGRYLWNLMGPRHGHAADTKVEDSSPQRRKVQ